MRVFALLLVLLGGACQLAAEELRESVQTDDRALYEAACTPCHGVRPTEAKRDGIDGWRRTVDEMVMRGAQLDAIEADRVTQYLTANFGPGASPMKTVLAGSDPLTGQATEVPVSEFPPGPGRDLVLGRCVICHDLGRIVSVRRTSTEWQSYTKDMIERLGYSESAENLQLMVMYLTENFGRQPHE